MNAVTIGPLALPLGLLALSGALTAGSVAGKWAARARRVDVESHYWLVVLTSLAVARAAFVAMYPDEYLAAPASMLDIRDGGFFAPAGILAGTAMAAWLGWRNQERRRPLAWAAGVAGAAWIATALAALAMPAPRMPLPDLAIAGIDGQSVTLRQLTGKPVVINLWAGWCPPCRREMPVLAAAQKRHPELHFVFANQGEPAETVRSYLSGQALGLDNVLLDSSRQLGRLLESVALPTTLFFDANGLLVEQRMGELSAATLAQKLESLGQAGKAGFTTGTVH